MIHHWWILLIIQPHLSAKVKFIFQIQEEKKNNNILRQESPLQLLGVAILNRCKY